MTLMLIVLGVIALVLPGMSQHASIDGHPRMFATLNAVSLGLGLATLWAGLALSVTAGVASLFSADPGVVVGAHHAAPGGLAPSALAGAGLLWLTARGCEAVRRLRRERAKAHAEHWLGRHESLGAHDLVILPTGTPVAYSVAGAPSQVVVSQGLFDELDHDLLRFVIDHERAHLRRRDHRYLIVAAVVEATLSRLPGVARSSLALRLAVERAADEEAAGIDPHHRRNLVHSLERLCTDRLPAGWTWELLALRAQRLVASPADGARRMAWIAGVGLAVILGAVLSVALHAAGDMPELLASTGR